MADRKAACARFLAGLQSQELRQADFAREVGCGKVAVSKVARGEQWPTIEMLEVLAARHNFSSTWILLGLGPMEIPTLGETPAGQSAHTLLSRLEGMGRPVLVSRAQGYIEGLIVQAEMEAEHESKGVA